jgi:hypothetical protein
MDSTDQDPQHESNQCFGSESTFLTFKFLLSFTNWLVKVRKFTNVSVSQCFQNGSGTVFLCLSMRIWICIQQQVTKRYRLSWLTYSALVYEPKCRGRGGVAGSQPMSAGVHRSPNIFGDLTPYLTYGIQGANFNRDLCATGSVFLSLDTDSDLYPGSLFQCGSVRIRIFPFTPRYGFGSVSREPVSVRICAHLDKSVYPAIRIRIWI